MTATDETPAQPRACTSCAATGWEYDRDACTRQVCPMRDAERSAQPDVAPAPDGNAGGADVYREAAKAMFELADGDNDDLFEWQNCPACPNGVRCACSGIPYPSAPVRAAIDAGRAPLLARIEHLTASHNFVTDEALRLRAEVERLTRGVATKTAVAQGNQRHAFDLMADVERLNGELAEAIRERDEARAKAEELLDLLRDVWAYGAVPDAVSDQIAKWLGPVTDDGGAG